MTKIMLDLETMGLKPGYVVLSLGAVLFDETGPIEPSDGADPEFHVRLDHNVQHAVGLRTDPDTAVWWMGRDAEAQNALLEMDVVPAQAALAAFADWVCEVADGENDDGTVKVEVWGNGANFDAPMLREVYEALGLKCPWAWYNERCYRTERRTLTALIRRYGGEVNEPRNEGIKHDALEDAQYQAGIYAHLHQTLDNVVSGATAG